MRNTINRIKDIDNRGLLLYICGVLMYQHKDESPEPFEQNRLSS